MHVPRYALVPGGHGFPGCFFGGAPFGVGGLSGFGFGLADTGTAGTGFGFGLAGFGAGGETVVLLVVTGGALELAVVAAAVVVC